MVSAKAVAVCLTITVVVVVIIVVPSVLRTQTAQFRATFMKTCLEFPEEEQICEGVRAAFERAFVGKDQRNVTEGDYCPLFDEFPFKHRCDKTMFWSKTKSVVHSFTQDRDVFVTLEDTLLGNVLNGREWCGKAGNREIYTKCGSSEPNPVSSFWRTASTRFAEYACGNATVMLDGEREEPYDSNSVFGGVEVPNLKPTRVAQLTVVLVVEKDGNQCNKRSLLKLNSMLTQRGIEYVCKEVEKSKIQKCIQESKPRGACW